MSYDYDRTKTAGARDPLHRYLEKAAESYRVDLGSAAVTELARRGFQNVKQSKPGVVSGVLPDGSGTFFVKVVQIVVTELVLKIQVGSGRKTKNEVTAATGPQGVAVTMAGLLEELLASL
jgi:hypothetical protein